MQSLMVINISKFKVLSSTRSKDMTGSPNLKKMGHVTPTTLN